MPTPNDSSLNLDLARPTESIRTSCPDETLVLAVSPLNWRFVEHGGLQRLDSSSAAIERQQSLLGATSEEKNAYQIQQASGKKLQKQIYGDNATSLKGTDHKQFIRLWSRGHSLQQSNPYFPSLSLDYPTRRLLPSQTCSFLRPGSKFIGKQTSDRSTYEVQVELKYVNMVESFLCGYLRIKGLTEDHPTLTTYFEGEMISDRYSFLTGRPEWGSSEQIDIQHWSLFPAFSDLDSKVTTPEFCLLNFAQRKHIFMRWKEYFLVPDHRVRQISGASFEGFYYICFSQTSGSVNGIYFHCKSERFQKLELSYVRDRTFGSVEFR